MLADVDGTLVTEDKVLTQRAQAAVRQTARRRHPFRHHQRPAAKGMAMLFDPLQLETPIAGFNGGLFVKPDLSIIEQKTLPADVAAKAIELIRAARPGCLGLPRQRLADRQTERAACRPRGLDGQVLTQGRARFRRLARQVVEDRRRQRRPDEVQQCEADAQQAFGSGPRRRGRSRTTST